MIILIRWGALSASFWVATALIPGIDVMGGFTTYLWVALLFGLLNATLGSILKLLTLPAVILTLGLFLVVVNAAILMLLARWSDKLDVTNFWSAIFAAVVISVITRLITGFTKRVVQS
ncbi:MAG: phage holin family protein [Actinomycetota bacterium]|nr:phage holin family protein [Actinomycetota bacterium]